MTTTFCFPHMFHAHIKNSRLEMPEDFDNYDKEKYPRFHVFLLAHLGFPFDLTDLEKNANIIADIPEEKIKTITFPEIIELGVKYSSSPLD